MKTFLAIIFCSLFLVGCNSSISCKSSVDTLSSSEAVDVETLRDIAYEWLDEYSQSTIINSKCAQIINGTDYYKIIFNTTDDELLGPISIKIDKSTSEVLDMAPRN